MPFLLACIDWKAEHSITHYIQEPRNRVECPGGHPRLFSLLRLLTPLPKIARGWYLSFPILPAWNANFHSRVLQISWNVCVTRQDWYSTHGGVETPHQAFAMPISQSDICYNRYNGPSVFVVQIIILNVGISLRNSCSSCRRHQRSPLLDSLYIMITPIEPA